jgi:hypothetical protein
MPGTITWARGVAACVALLVGTAPAVHGHHSFAVEYDGARPVEIRGTVTQVDWVNPHARFVVDARVAPDRIERWHFDLASPNVLARNGWRRERLKVGADITVTGYRAKTGERRAIAEAITRPDGTPLFAGIAGI